MPKTRVAEIVSEVIENAIAPMLKARGYRRNGTPGAPTFDSRFGSQIVGAPSFVRRSGKGGN